MNEWTRTPAATDPTAMGAKIVSPFSVGDIDARTGEGRPIEHWYDANPQTFTRTERGSTTLMFGGLSAAADFLIGAALEGLGYNVRVLDVPDYEALHFGKEFGNRGQCNPTYFTVGNLVKHLAAIEATGPTKAEIVRDFVFVTAGACGPCRFGNYATEYRKALRDAGYDGFRVLILDNNGGIKQACGDELGLELGPRFFLSLLAAILVGDVLNVLTYRIRPYEVVPGATDAALVEAKEILREGFRRPIGLYSALRRARRVFAAIEVDRLRPKPKVSVIGEFWAMTTEGDGNYRLQRFLEQEGAEVEVQMVTAWILYIVWQNRWDTRRRRMLRHADHARMGLGDQDARKKLVLYTIADRALKGAYKVAAWAIGLKGHSLPDMDELAELGHEFYDNHLRGGEGHLEVAKVVQTAKKRKAHMVVSVKPFGCLPSSGISDGVQSKVTEVYPDAVFCAVETTGDAAVMVQSRVQMQLFKARENARAEFDRVLAASGLTLDEARAAQPRSALAHPSVHGIAGTAARVVAEVPFWRRWIAGLRRPRAV
ncbi:MAG: hypothetical protein ABTQ29_13735 [Siculibacillus sp.]